MAPMTILLIHLMLLEKRTIFRVDHLQISLSYYNSSTFESRGYGKPSVLVFKRAHDKRHDLLHQNHVDTLWETMDNPLSNCLTLFLSETLKNVHRQSDSPSFKAIHAKKKSMAELHFGLGRTPFLMFSF